MPDDVPAAQMTATKTKAVVVFVAVFADHTMVIADHTMVRSIRCRAVITDGDVRAPAPPRADGRPTALLIPSERASRPRDRTSSFSTSDDVTFSRFHRFPRLLG